MNWSKANQISCPPVNVLPVPMKTLLHHAQLWLSPQQPELDFKWVIMTLSVLSCYISAVALRVPQHFLWVFTCSFPCIDPNSQSASLTAMHSQQACVEKQLWQAQKKLGDLFKSCVFHDLYKSLWSSFLAKSDGGGGGCQMLSSCYMAQLFYFELWGYRFLWIKWGTLGEPFSITLIRMRDCTV